MKVLVNGCSHIQGCSLHPDPGVARTLTWPNFVPGWQVNNIAEAGSSNDSIRRRTIQHLDQHSDYDLVYIQWTYWHRIELEIPEWQIKNLRQWCTVTASDAQTGTISNPVDSRLQSIARSIFTEQFDTQWFRDYSLVQILALQQFLKSKGIRYRFGFAMDVPDTCALAALLDHEQFFLPTWVEFCGGRFSFAAQHWGRDAHENWANTFGEQFK